MDTVDILCRARELYASAPSHVAHPHLPPSGTYCAVMALAMVKGVGVRAVDTPAYDALVRATGVSCGSVADWNAEHSTAEVLAAFDRAIAAQRLHVPDLTATGREAVHA